MEDQRVQFSDGDIVVAKINTHMDDYIFVRVVGRTKTGNLRVQRLKTIEVKSAATPAESWALLAPDPNTPIAPSEVARWSKVDKGFRIKNGPDFYYVLERKWNEGDTVEKRSYY